MAKPTSTANWQNIDIDSLPTANRAEYDAYKAAYAAMKAAREKFEGGLRSALAEDMPAGKRAVFGYNFGKLSCAIVDDEEKAKAKSPGSISLASLVKA